MKVDVAVVGSGPAGSLAAHHLATQGVGVVLVEREKLPRYKTCGGGVVGRAARLLPFPPMEVTRSACNTAELHLSDRHWRFAVERDEPIIYMTTRDELDYRLAMEAARAGAEVVDRCEVTGFSVDNEGATLTTTTGTINARLVIAADGATGRLASMAGWPRRMGAPALEEELEVGSAGYDAFRSTARFDFGTVPHGYAWVFPKRELLSVGVLSSMRGKVNLQQCLTSYLARLGIERARSRRRQGYIVPLKPIGRGFVRNRTLLCGDAAGFADAATAEGISGALISGRAVAAAIVQHGFDEASVRKCYHDELRRTLLPELRVSRRLAQLVYGRTWIRDRLFAANGAELVELITDVFTGARTYAGETGKLARYLHLFWKSAWMTGGQPGNATSTH